MKKLENKKAIITGAGSGIGRSIAEAFAREGARIIVADIDEQGGKETVEKIKESGGEAVFVKTDVSRADEVENMVQTCVNQFGGLDILVNNAGIFKTEDLHELDEKVWDQTLNVNLKGTFLGTKSALKEFLKQEKGKIINIASIAGFRGFNQASAYCASKGGIIAFTKSAALDYAPKGININAIAPGVIETAMTNPLLEDPEQAKTFKANTPYPRLGKPSDIAQAAVYLASSDSDFVNGEVLTVDGGWTAK